MEARSLFLIRLLVALQLLSSWVLGQIIHRDEAAPSCWQFGSTPWTQAQTFVNTTIHRVLDVGTWNPQTGQITFCWICNGMSHATFARPHAVDVAVTRPGAISLANTSGMFISAVAPFQLGGTTVFVSLREQLPAGCSWTWIPATTPSAITTWLQANPSYYPYSVDTSVDGAGLSYHVMAMTGPGVRATTLQFQQALGALPSPSYPGGNSVISFAMDSATTFAAVVQLPTASVRTDYIAILPTASGYQYGSIQAQMERVFSLAHWHSTSGTTEFGLVVNNAWSLYDIFGVPEGSNFRGCPNSVGVSTLSVTSSTGSVATLGATLSFFVAPKDPAGVGLMVFGLNRLPSFDLSILGVPSCYLIASPDVIAFATDFGGFSRLDLPITGALGLPGQRFYAQGAILDANGFSTSNAFMITAE